MAMSKRLSVIFRAPSMEKLLMTISARVGRLIAGNHWMRSRLRSCTAVTSHWISRMNRRISVVPMARPLWPEMLRW